jgi:hypothetical protein
MRFTGTWHDQPRFVDGGDCRVAQRRTVLHRENVIWQVAGVADGLQRLRDLEVWTTVRHRQMQVRLRSNRLAPGSANRPLLIAFQ